MQRNFRMPHNKHAVPLLERELTDKIIGAAIEVHQVLAPGLLEPAYQVCMERESTLRNICFERVGLLINFNAPSLKDGIYRRVL